MVFVVKLPIAAVALFLVVCLVIAFGGAGPAQAQGQPTAPATPHATGGTNPDEVTVTWGPVEDAGFYRIGWLSAMDYRADLDAGRDWRDSFTFRTVANTGQSSYTVDGLTPGDQYAFLVGTSTTRHSTPEWSP